VLAAGVQLQVLQLLQLPNVLRDLPMRIPSVSSRI
jgi:hypothetical protein